MLLKLTMSTLNSKHFLPQEKLQKQTANKKLLAKTVNKTCAEQLLVTAD